MINSVDAIVVYVYQKADTIALQQTQPYDQQKLIDLAYLRGLVSAMYINQQISAERYWELCNELQAVKITGSKFFASQAK